MRRLLLPLLAALLLAAPASARIVPSYVDDDGGGQTWGIIWTCGWTESGLLCATWWCAFGACERIG